MKKIILFFCLLLFACSPSEKDLRKKDGLYYKKNEDLPFSGTITIDYMHQAIFEDGNYKIVLTDTAGYRKTGDSIEKIGIQKTMEGI